MSTTYIYTETLCNQKTAPNRQLLVNIATCITEMFHIIRPVSSFGKSFGERLMPYLNVLTEYWGNVWDEATKVKVRVKI